MVETIERRGDSDCGGRGGGGASVGSRVSKRSGMGSSRGKGSKTYVRSTCEVYTRIVSCREQNVCELFKIHDINVCLQKRLYIPQEEKEKDGDEARCTLFSTGAPSPPSTLHAASQRVDR